MSQIASGTQVIHKTGGPKMKVRWYVNETHVETSWYKDSKEQSDVFNINDLEFWDDISATDIEVIDFIMALPI